MQASTGLLWGERTTGIILESKLQAVVGRVSKLLGKEYFLTV